MVKRCIVRGCETGCPGNTGIPIFTCPRKDLLPAWQEAIPRREKSVNPPPLTMSSHVCAKHFLSNDLVTHQPMTLPNGTVIMRKHFRPLLSKNAVPCKFGSDAVFEVPGQPMARPTLRPLMVQQPAALPLTPPTLEPLVRPALPPLPQPSQARPQPSLSLSLPPLPQSSQPLPMTPTRVPMDMDVSRGSSGAEVSMDGGMAVDNSPVSFTSRLNKENLPPITTPSTKKDPTPSTSRTPALPPVSRVPRVLPFVQDSSENISSPPVPSTPSGHSTPLSSQRVEGLLADETVELPDNILSPQPNPVMKTVIHSQVHSIKLPGKFWGFHTDGEKKTAFTKIDNNIRVEKAVIFTDSPKPVCIIQKTQIDVPEVKTKSEIEALLRKVHNMKACCGYTDEDNKHRAWAKGCHGYVPVTSIRTTRCLKCIIKRKVHKKNEMRMSAQEKLKAIRAKVRIHAQRSNRLSRQVEKLQASMKSCMKQIDLIKQQTLEEILKKLPEEQRVLVQTCFDAARHHNKKSRRYTTDWIYECLIMRIKAPALYEQLRTSNKLALPDRKTLRNYLSALRPAFGFQENVFKLLEEMAQTVPEGERHGSLLLDEMALESKTFFDKTTCMVHGLVDLGGLEDSKEAELRGDHALVVMYQPFRGKSVQAIGAFLSHGAVKAPKLHKIILEAIALLEKSGYYTDIVVTDAATWNRSMWDIFGINKDQPSCEHPLDSRKQLRFASDFPHLIKNLWCRILSKKILNVPDGQIRLDHWVALYQEEERKGIKGAFTLQKDHIEPTTFQKMKVRLGMQFFGERIADAMQHYLNLGIAGLQDAAPTIAFIRRINAVVDAMNSQLPCHALKPNPDSTHYMVLTSFLEYLDQMNNMAKEKYEKINLSRTLATGRKPRKRPESQPYVGYDDEITASIFLGLVVTIKNTLSLVDYLSQECNYLYLMTRRINQDPLEHFFGHVRGACGGNSHPDPRMFLNVYRLLMTYSLVKPPRGSNVTGGQVLDAMIKLKDFKGEQNSKMHQELLDRIDEVLDSDIIIPEESTLTCNESLSAPVDTYALTVFGGYVARKVRAMKPYEDCLECRGALYILNVEQPWEERESLLQIRTHGGLLRPTQELHELLYKLEEAVQTVSSSMALHSTILFTVLDELLSSNTTFGLLGCEQHARGLTTNIITSFLNTRMHFVCASADRAAAEKNRINRDLAKRAKLT